MKKYIKIIPIILAAGALISCNSNSSTTPTNTSTPVPTTSTPRPTLPPSTPEPVIETDIADFVFGTNVDNTASITRYNYQNGDTVHVVIPEKDPEGRTITSIARSAFFYAGGIESVYIPSTITSIDQEAFQSLTTLTSYEVAENNPNFAAKDGWLVSKDEKTLISCPAAIVGEGTVKLIDGITSIAPYAFYYSRAKTIDLDNGSLTTIGQYAFARARVATTTIPNTVTSVGSYAFNYSYLDTITLGTGLTEISAHCFDHSTMLQNITIPGNIKKVGNGAFENANLITLKIEEGVEEIGEDAFYFNQRLANVSLPSSLRIIGNSAFANAYNLAQLVLPEGLTTIGAEAFYYNARLVNINIPSTVTSIGSGAFGLCSLLTNLVVDEGNEHFVVENGLFYDINKTRLICYAPGTRYVGGIILPDTLQRIENYAFAEAFSINSVTIPESVTYIGGNVFTRNSSTVESTLAIVYLGTKAQWAAITKAVIADTFTWDSGAPITSITCSDGPIE